MVAPFLLVAVALQVPYVHQHRDTCAAASLAMVMAYLKQDVTQEEIARALVQPELRGIPGSRLAAFASSRGLEAITYSGDMAQLREFVGKGRPLIVAWHLGGQRYHDVVVVGFDDERDTVLVNDPAAGAGRSVSAATFEKRWAGADHWTLLVGRKP
ncbi:MAG TPA: papain-like cysteine protease family protein [Vicinamibacteria bacterium]|nr:papain-like cysteine protease family protein [Vicinamibacteria bacterium]